MRLLLIVAVALLMLTPAARAEEAAKNEKNNLLGSKEKFFTSKLGQRIPMDLKFTDETGKKVTLSDYDQKKPIILVPAYFKCPMLCTLVLNDLIKGLRGVTYTPGQEFEILVVSFDPTETPELAASKKKTYVEEYNRPGAEVGWHFLTGEQDQIDALLDALGYKVMWDESQKQYAHARAIFFLTSNGIITRHFLDGAYPPRDVRLAIVDASEGRVGSPMDRVLLMCFNYNPVEGKYSVAVLNVVRMGGLATLGSIAVFWSALWLFVPRRGKVLQSPEIAPKVSPEATSTANPEAAGQVVSSAVRGEKA